MIGSFRRVGRYYHTLRHLKRVQITGRIGAELRKRAASKGFVWPGIPQPPGGLRGQLSPRTRFLRHDPWNRREELLRGRFSFLNHSADLGRPVVWEPDLPLLWRFNLHYFNYLHLLEPPEAQALCLEWIDGNPLGRTVGWHPYPTSLRIVNWCKAGLNHSRHLESLYSQAAYLSRNMEVHLQGNHWLENARALIFAGFHFSGSGESSAWLAAGLKVFREEIPVQVLSDGAHFERSPMYHALMLESCLDVLNLLPDDHPDRGLLLSAVAKMADFLLSATHPDGGLALFNDSALKIAPDTARLGDYAAVLLGRPPKRAGSFGDAGYFVWNDADAYLIIDGGPVGPDFLPGHAHADIFSFELSLGGLRFIVDSGTHDYVAGPFRSHLRGTAAHNTVCVDGTDQVECWGVFRVARRFAPKDVHVEERGRAWSFRGVFDGYRALIGDGIVHTREVFCDAPKRRIRIEDTVSGRGVHRLESRLHVHPEVKLTRGEGTIVLKRGDMQCRLESEGAVARVEEDCYCPEFGVRMASPVIVLGGDLSLPTKLAFTLEYQRLDSGEGGSLRKP